MSNDRGLIDSIKFHFARKMSAQLQQIAQSRPQEHWSPEAIVAAGEVLHERMQGRAQEPLVAEEDPPPPPTPPDAYSLAFLALGAFGSLSGLMLLHLYHFDYASGPERDLPVPFGPRMAWLALDTSDTAAVASAVGLRNIRSANWAEGIDASHQSAVFVTPPLGDWTLVLGRTLFPPDRAEVFIKPLLERLSRQFGDAQYFCTYREVELHIWARARHGQLVRGYGWLGDKNLTLWDEGAQTKEEKDLGFCSVGDPQGNKSRWVPDESILMQLACLWSVDPTSLNEQFKEPIMGLLADTL
jgi:hypothetical protein